MSRALDMAGDRMRKRNDAKKRARKMSSVIKQTTGFDHERFF
jgi:hypothetical protein